MTFHITASNKTGPIKLARRTAKEAFELARSYRSKGYEAINVTNVETGETFAEPDIVENRMPASPTSGPKASVLPLDG